MADTRTGEEQLAARQAGTAGGDLTAAELRARTQAEQREQRREEAKRFADEEFRKAQAEAKAEGRTVTSQTLRINLESGLVKGKTTSVDSSSFRRPQDQTPVINTGFQTTPQDVVKSPPRSGGGEADFSIGVPLKGAPGRIQEVDPSTGNINTIQFQQVRGPTRYNVNIEDSISGYIPGKTHFKVELGDSISGRKPNEFISQARPRELAPIRGIGTPTIAPPNLQSNRSTKDIFGPGDTSDPRYFVDAPLGNLGNTVNAFIRNAPSAKSFGDLSYKMEIEKPLFKPKESASGLLVDASYQAIAKNDFKALGKGFAEPIAKNPAILGSLVTDAALFALPGGRVGSGIRGAGRAIKETSFIKGISASATRTPYSSVIKRADAQTFKPTVATPNLSLFKKTTVSLGRGEAQVAPLVTERRVFENTRINLGKGSARETPLKPFKSETINLGTSRVAGLGDVSSKTFKPRQIKPEDFGAKETLGSDGLLQIVKQESKQQTKQASATSEASQFQSVSINLGRGTVQGIRADTSKTDSVTKSLLGIRSTSEQTAKQRRQANSATSEFAAIGFRTRDTQDFLKSLQQSGLFKSQSQTKSKSEQVQSFKTETGQTFKFDFKPFQVTGQKSSQLFKQESKQEFKIDFGISQTQDTRIDFDIPSPPPSRPPGITTDRPTRIPKLFDLDFGEPEKKKQKRRKGRRSRKSEVKLGNPITAVLGRDSKAGRRAAKFLDKFDFDF